MATLDGKTIGKNLALARRSVGLTQTALATAAHIHRIQIVRMEAGLVIPRLDEAIRLAEVLQVPLEKLVTGRWFARTDLKGIAIELYYLGIRDLEVADPQVPGSFRYAEEVLVLAVSGDRPEPRVVEAIPFVLARQRLRASLVAAFSIAHEKRALIRLAWLSDITLALSQLSTMPVPLESWAVAQLRTLIKMGNEENTKEHPESQTDSLGHPATSRVSPIWRRWNIAYAGTLQDFLRRTIEVDVAFQSSRTTSGGEW